MISQDVIIIRVKIKREEIAYVCSIVESYDHFAVTRTVDSAQGIIEFLVSPDFISEMNCLLVDLIKETGLEILNQGTTDELARSDKH